MSFQDKVCIVTGATSGIGAAIAEVFGARGARLILVGRNAARGQEIAAKLGAAGVSADFVAADMRAAETANYICDTALSKHGRIDVLVNNAGILKRGAVHDCPIEDWEETLDINLNAVFRLSRAVIPSMLKQKAGAIVNIGSDWSLTGAKDAVAYCVTKAAVVQMTRCMALDYAAHGIRVNAVCPGETDTPMLDKSFEGKGANAKQKFLEENVPMGRAARPAEIANTVAFLASDDASFITGAYLSADGGASAG